MKTWIVAPGAKFAAGLKWMAVPPPETVTAPSTSTPFCDTYIAPATVAASSGLLTNSVTSAPAGNPDPVGRCVRICGRLDSTDDPVLNVLEKSASAFPDVSVTSPVATTVISASNGSVVVRKTVVLSAEREILELISVAPEKSANVLLLTVDGCNGSEKVSVTTAAGPMPVAPSGGVTMTTVGGCGVRDGGSRERRAEALQRVCRPGPSPFHRSSSRQGSAFRLGTEPAA